MLQQRMRVATSRHPFRELSISPAGTWITLRMGVISMAAIRVTSANSAVRTARMGPGE
jgi:hypothetical protein